MSNPYIPYAQQLAQQYSIPWPLFVAWINQESGWNPTAQSDAGAQGIAQIMPDTAAGWGVNPWNPTDALQAAAMHLSEYYTQFGNSWPNALAAYNAGGGAVTKYGGIPPYAQTQNYVATIMHNAGLGGSSSTGSSSSSSTPWYEQDIPKSPIASWLGDKPGTGSPTESWLQQLGDVPVIGGALETLSANFLVAGFAIAFFIVGGAWLIFGNSKVKSTVVKVTSTAAKVAAA